MIASLDDEQVLLDRTSRENVYEHIYKIIERDNLSNYFMAMTGSWFDEWVAQKDKEAAGSESVEIEKPIMNEDIKPNPKAEEYDQNTERAYWQMIGKKVKRDLGR